MRRSGCREACRTLSGNDQRTDLDEPNRRGEMGGERLASPPHLLGRIGAAHVTVVHVPSPLHSYTSGRSEVTATGPTLSDLLSDLDRQFPGFRFRVVDEQDRIRSTILFYVGSHGPATRP